MDVKKISRIVVPVLILALVMFACSRGESGVIDPSPSPDVTVTVRPTPTPTPTPTPSPTPAPIYTHPLTGRIIDEPFPNTRPWAVSINNVPQALPQCSIAYADMIFEVVAEGATRMIALYSSLDEAGKIGSIRSVRPYFIEISSAYDAILIHSGGSEQAYYDLAANKLDHIDGTRGDSAAFYREPSRLGWYAIEHTQFSTAELLHAGMERAGHRAEHDIVDGEAFDYGLNFNDELELVDGETADTIHVMYAFCGKFTDFTYDDADNKYYMRQTWWNTVQDYIDGNTEQKVGFENVLILYTNTYALNDDLAHLSIETTGFGTGYFAYGGRYIEIKWSRTSGEPFIFTTIDDEPLELGVGTTFVCSVAPTANSEVKFS